MSVHYVIDGYNVIKQVPALAKLNLQSGRAELYRYILSHRPQGSSKNLVTVVFDGRAGIGGSETTTEISVIFASQGSADEKIKQLVQKARLKSSLVVVTDDRDIQYYVRALGAKVLGVGDFMGKVRPHHDRTYPAKRLGKTDKDAKDITRTMESEINRELQQIWLERKKRTHE